MEKNKRNIDKASYKMDQRYKSVLIYDQEKEDDKYDYYNESSETIKKATSMVMKNTTWFSCVLSWSQTVLPPHNIFSFKATVIILIRIKEKEVAELGFMKTVFFICSIKVLLQKWIDFSFLFPVVLAFYKS